MAERQAARLLLQPCLRTVLPRRSTILAALTTTPGFIYSSASIANARATPEGRRAASSSKRQNKYEKTAPRKSTLGRRGVLATMDRTKTEVNREQGMALLLPGTFIAQPFWTWPAAGFLAMAWQAVRTRARNWYSLMSHKVMSQPATLRSRAQYKLKRGTIRPAAKALHLAMNEAVARGDREALRAICTPEFYETLVGAVDTRPRGERAEWELIKYTDKLVYPRITDDQVTMLGESLVLRQTVVTIASVQRIARYGSDDKMVPGSEKLRSLKENLVLMAAINNKTWEQGPWKIWGTVPDTKIDEFLEEKELFEAMSEENAKGK